MDHLCNINNNLVFQCMKEDINVLLTEYYENQWSMKINRESAIHGNGRNKLRTYRTFKQSFETEYYVKTILPRKARQALAKFHCGVTPLRIETGRYLGEREENRLCVLCIRMVIENEDHCLIRCNKYTDIRNTLFAAAIDVESVFIEKMDGEKLSFILSSVMLVFETAKACQQI